jgi:holo-[acyl-carrier protein] synthase
MSHHSRTLLLYFSCFAPNPQFRGYFLNLRQYFPVVSFGVCGQSTHNKLVVDMTIVGHGIDLVDVAEIRRWIEDPRDPLIPRCFTQEELDEIGNGTDRIERLAGRFAAKEAVLKALGTGFGVGVAFSDVVIHRVAGLPPQVRLVGGAAKAAVERGINGWQLSISHTSTLAMASAIATFDAAHSDGLSHSRSASEGPA